MQDFWWSYWWLIFPIGAFAFGAWERWLSYQRSRDTLELLKTYAAQGKEPPPEISRRLNEDLEDDEFAGERMGRRYRRYYRHYRWSPYRDWRSAIILGSIAGAMWFAAWQGYIPGAVAPLKLIATILTFIAGARLLSAVLGSRFPPR